MEVSAGDTPCCGLTNSSAAVPGGCREPGPLGEASSAHLFSRSYNDFGEEGPLSGWAI